MLIGGIISMDCQVIDIHGTWREVADCARVTANMEPGTGEPASWWKTKMLLAEHSPIREITVIAEWTGISYWVAMHLVRHHQGCQPYVMSQRDDRQKEVPHQSRKDKPQDAPVKLRFTFNQQAIINISRKRLCQKAAKETREAWQMLVKELRNTGQRELSDACVPECVYRGFCPEMDSCGFCLTDKYEDMLAWYHRVLLFC